MNQNDRSDWRITEGAAIGYEPVFDITDINFHAHFYSPGSTSRSLTASLLTKTPTIVESIHRTLPEMTGLLKIFDSHPDQSYPGLYPGHFDCIALGNHRGALGVRAPDNFIVHLYLPPDQFAGLLPLLLCGSPCAQLHIEIDRTLDQGLPDSDCYFWNDLKSPVVLFNEFRIDTFTGEALSNKQSTERLG